MIKKYMKKPIPVDAIQWTGNNHESIIKWANGRVKAKLVTYNCDAPEWYELSVYTLEGIMKPNVGDYVVKGSMDDVWFVKKEIFEVTYEEIP